MVRYSGFMITPTGLQPTPEFLASIRDFPTPTNITDVRSWFGAINQISYAFAAAPAMLPFRQLLSSKVPFHWNSELEEAFQALKEEIIGQCRTGVRSFSLTAPTALATDWSKCAMGFWLAQKVCSCSGPPTPGCCPSGWQTVYCGSRFCTPAESKYHPIEGEACAAINGLDKCRAFVLGNPQLILALDHKPLLKVLGPAELDEVLNPRLMNFKLRSLAYRFKPIFIPGKNMSSLICSLVARTILTLHIVDQPNLQAI